MGVEASLCVLVCKGQVMMLSPRSCENPVKAGVDPWHRQRQEAASIRCSFPLPRLGSWATRDTSHHLSPIHCIETCRMIPLRAQSWRKRSPELLPFIGNSMPSNPCYSPFCLDYQEAQTSFFHSTVIAAHSLSAGYNYSLLPSVII